MNEIEFLHELDEIKKEIEKLRKLVTIDLIRVIEKSIEDKLESIVLSILSTLGNEILQDKMPKECERYDRCLNNLANFLDGALNKGLKVKDIAGHYKDMRMALLSLKRNALYERCKNCFSETATLLKNQEKALTLFRDTLKGYILAEINSRQINAEKMMERLEPVSNPIRLKILLELYNSPCRFTQLSKITGLYGGNLRFHIKKLIKAGLIIQERKGGEYMLSERGRVFIERLVHVLEAI